MELASFQIRLFFNTAVRKPDKRYSRCLKSERSVWKTKQNLVPISDVWISDIQFVRFVQSFGYTINVQNPHVWLVESINPTSEIRTVWEWDNFGKRRDPNVGISDIYCTVNSKISILKYLELGTVSV